MSDEYLRPIRIMLERAADPVNAVPMKKYLRGRFEFLGIQTPERRRICREFVGTYGLPERSALDKIVLALWNAPQREYQHFGVELCERFMDDPEKWFIDMFERMATDKSWWDTVDFIATKLVGRLFMVFPGMIRPKTRSWVSSNNIWLQRIALLFQLKYKDRTDTKLLYSYIERLAGSKEFFIRKAIGWALREYSKTDPGSVKRFVESREFAPLIKREAFRRIDG